MSKQNHGGITPMSIATQTLGTRAIAFKDELGLSGQQVESVLNVSSRWRRRYNELVKDIVALSEEIDHLLNEFHPPRKEIDQLIERRITLIHRMEQEFVDAWVEMTAIYTPEQDQELQRIYRQEFEGIPHRRLGYT